MIIDYHNNNCLIVDVNRDFFDLQGAGIKNMGNTCFMSAILQCFTHISQFVLGVRYCWHNYSPCKDIYIYIYIIFISLLFVSIYLFIFKRF
jgi:ubiquitin C-terminal hydrolase